MKKLGLVYALSLSVVLLAGCMNKTHENIETEIIDEENIIVEEPENLEEEIIEEVVEEEVVDGERWNLLAFNGKEVDGDYKMTITNDGKLYTKFCNDMGGDVIFEGNENEGTISVSLNQNKILCEGESMDLENAFQIDGASYTTIENEDGGKTIILTTINGDKFTRRTILN